MQPSNRKMEISSAERKRHSKPDSKFLSEIHMSTLTLEQCFQKHNLSIMTFIGQLLLPGEFGLLLFYSISAKRKSYMACFDLALSFLKAFLSFSAETLKLTCYPLAQSQLITKSTLCCVSLYSSQPPISDFGTNNKVLIVKPQNVNMRSLGRNWGGGGTRVGRTSMKLRFG